MDVLDTGKKLFFLILGLAAFLFAVLYSSGIRFPPQSAFSPERNKSFPRPPVPLVLLLPGKIAEPSLASYRDLIHDLWGSWALQISSFVVLGLKEEPKGSDSYRVAADREGAAFVWTFRLERKEGRTLLQPLLYVKSDPVLLKSRPVEWNEFSLAESILQGFQSLLALTERNLRSKYGSSYSLERGGFLQEQFLPSSDALGRYLHLRSQEAKGMARLQDWEELAKRENLFWLPWERYIWHKFSGREDSYEYRYFLDSLSRKLPSYFSIELAKMSLEGVEKIAGKSETWKVLPLLELSFFLFEKSGKTLNPDYARLLLVAGDFFLRDRKWADARASLLNARLVLDNLNQTQTPLYQKSRFLLARALRESGQTDLAVRELESFLSSAGSKEGWNLEDRTGQDPEVKLLTLYNLGCLYLATQKPQTAEGFFRRVETLLLEKHQFYSDFFLQTRVNRIASLLQKKDWNRAIAMGQALESDLSILGLEKSEFDWKNAFNLALAFKHKGAEETFREYFRTYEKKAPYSRRRSVDPEALPEAFGEIYQWKVENGILSSNEERALAALTGKYEMEKHPVDVRSRTYANRLEDQEIFLREFLGAAPPFSDRMERLRRLFSLQASYRTGKGVIFIDIGPGIANPISPAITSVSLFRSFPDLSVVLLDLPGEVNLFLKNSDPKLRREILSYPNVWILAGDGVLPLRNFFRRKEGWVLKERGIPEVKGKLVVVRCANSIDVYEPYSRVRPFLESLVQDFRSEDLVLLFNRLIFAKPAGARRLTLVGSFSARGFSHNEWNLDRKGELPYFLSGIVLGED